jgi:hypothetical protein
MDWIPSALRRRLTTLSTSPRTRYSEPGWVCPGRVSRGRITVHRRRAQSALITFNPSSPLLVRTILSPSAAAAGGAREAQSAGHEQTHDPTPRHLADLTLSRSRALSIAV